MDHFYRNRLNVGLFKLSEANSLVGEMSVELESLGPKIEEKQRVCSTLISPGYVSQQNINAKILTLLCSNMPLRLPVLNNF